MGRGVKRWRNLVHPAGDDLSIFDHNRGKWPAAAVYVINRQLNRFMYKFVTVHPAPCRSTCSRGFLAPRASPEKSSVRIENKKQQTKTGQHIKSGPHLANLPCDEFA